MNAIFDFNVSCERRVESNVIRERTCFAEIISGCLCTSLSSVHGHTNADTRQHKNSSNFQMATFSYVCQLSLISIRKQIKSVVCHRHIPTKGDVMCYLFNDLEPTHGLPEMVINYVTPPKA